MTSEQRTRIDNGHYFMISRAWSLHIVLLYNTVHKILIPSRADFKLDRLFFVELIKKLTSHEEELEMLRKELQSKSKLIETLSKQIAPTPKK